MELYVPTMPASGVAIFTRGFTLILLRLTNTFFFTIG